MGNRFDRSVHFITWFSFEQLSISCQRLQSSVKAERVLRCNFFISYEPISRMLLSEVHPTEKIRIRMNLFDFFFDLGDHYIF